MKDQRFNQKYGINYCYIRCIGWSHQALLCTINPPTERADPDDGANEKDTYACGPLHFRCRLFLHMSLAGLIVQTKTTN